MLPHTKDWRATQPTKCRNDRDVPALISSTLTSLSVNVLHPYSTRCRSLVSDDPSSIACVSSSSSTRR